MDKINTDKSFIINVDNVEKESNLLVIDERKCFHRLLYEFFFLKNNRTKRKKTKKESRLQSATNDFWSILNRRLSRTQCHEFCKNLITISVSQKVSLLFI